MKTIIQQFVPYYLALKLRVLGFNEECLAWWNCGGRDCDFNLYGADSILDCLTNPQYEDAKLRSPAPTWFQAFNFMDEKFGKGHRNFFIKDFETSVKNLDKAITLYRQQKVEEKLKETDEEIIGYASYYYSDDFPEFYDKNGYTIDTQKFTMSEVLDMDKFGKVLKAKFTRL